MFTKPTLPIEKYSQPGVVSRDIDDVMLIQKVIAGRITQLEKESLFITYEENRNSSCHRYISFSKSINLTFDVAVTVYVLKNQPRGSWLPYRSPQRDQINAVEKIAEAFRDNGNKVIEIEISEMNDAFHGWAAMMDESKTGVCHREKLSKGKQGGWNLLLELVKNVSSFGLLSNYTLPLLWQSAMFEIFTKKSQKSLDREVVKFQTLKKKIYKILNTPLGEESTWENVIMVVPSLPMIAPKHGPLPQLLFGSQMAATSIYNVLELPATAVPTGLGTRMCPTGAQVVGGYGKDMLCLDAVKFLQDRGIARYELPRYM